MCRTGNEPESLAEPHHVGIANGGADVQPHDCADQQPHDRADLTEPDGAADCHTRPDRLAVRAIG